MEVVIRAMFRSVVRCISCDFEDTVGLQLTVTLFIPTVEDSADVTGVAP